MGNAEDVAVPTTSVLLLPLRQSTGRDPRPFSRAVSPWKRSSLQRSCASLGVREVFVTW